MLLRYTLILSKGPCDHVYTLVFNYMYCILCNDIVINPILHFV